MTATALSALVRERLVDIGLVLLIPNGRSGSMLMQSLFDGHPEVVSFPYWMKRYAWRSGDGDTREQIADRFCEQTSLFGGNALQLGSNREEHPEIDVEAFRRELLIVLDCVPFAQLDDRSIFVCGHLALARLLGLDLARLKYIVMHVHEYSRISLPAVQADFPNLYFIAMHRDPREEWVSYIRAYDSEYGAQNLIDKLLGFIDERFTIWNNPFLDFYRTCPPGHVRIVDLNRLHAMQDGAMRELAEWLGVVWSDDLTRSTFLGQPWAGNSFTGVPVHGFESSRAAYTWHEKLPAKHIALLNYFFFPLLAACGYALPPSRPARRVMLRHVLLTLPVPFLPRPGSPYLKQREKIDKAFHPENQSPPKGGVVRILVRLGAGQSLAWEYRMHVARHLFTFFKGSVRAVQLRYSLRRLTRIEAMADRYDGVQLSDLTL